MPVPEAPQAPVHRPSQLQIYADTIPSKVRLPNYWIDGMMPEGREQAIRNAVDVMQPRLSPKTVHLIAPQEWNKYQTQAKLGAGKFRFNHSDLGNGFSDKDGNIWLNSGVPDADLFHTIGHEFGHRDGKTSNEGEADATAEPYYKRLDSYRQYLLSEKQKQQQAVRPGPVVPSPTTGQAR